MKTHNYTILFSLILCVFTSISLSWCFVALKDRREKNEEMEKKRNILNASGIKLKDTREIEEIFNKLVTVLNINKKGEIIDQENDKAEKLTVYRIEDKINNLTTFVYPIKGKGLWSTLEGYLSVYPDGSKIKGITFYKHGETPGLGAEIEKDWFTKNFENKLLYNNKELIGVEVVKGKAKNNILYKTKKDNIVDGISGATITGNGVTKMLKLEPKKYHNFFNRSN